MTGGTGVTTIDGRRLSYRRAGTEGPPVVCCHGGGVDHAELSWRYVVDDLAADHRVYAFDWPGYGDSDDLAEADHSVETYVEILESFLERVGLVDGSGDDTEDEGRRGGEGNETRTETGTETGEPITLAGISMGGAAALGFALEHPERVDRLVLVDSYGLGRRIPAGSLWKAFAHLPGANAWGWTAMGLSREATRTGLGNVVADAGGLSSAFVDDVYERARLPDAGQAFEAFQRNELAADGTALTDYSDDERLETLSVPTLLVHGEDDPLFQAAWSERAAARLPNAHLEIIEECGHWPPRERPDRFLEVLRAFLERNRR